MKIKVWSLTFDGDNQPIETAVFGSLSEARKHLIDCLPSWDITAGTGGRPLEALTDGELCDLWENAADGMCAFEEHEIEIGQ